MDGNDRPQAAGGILEHVDAFMGIVGRVIEHEAPSL